MLESAYFKTATIPLLESTLDHKKCGLGKTFWSSECLMYHITLTLMRHLLSLDIPVDLASSRNRHIASTSSGWLGSTEMN